MNVYRSEPAAALFDAVAVDYVHVRKEMRATPPLTAPGIFLKWYLINPPDRPFTESEVQAAQSFLLAEIKSGRLRLHNEVGFTVQHRCANVDIFYVCSWRNNNELWETLYTLTVGGTYQLAERDNTTGTYCVWVIPAVTYEQQAWLACLRSSRDDSARRRYCEDQVSGEVG
ncbi:hypothetical protein [Reyranella sp.]|uniref:hypothetical protein n=1 Tax=Reyranella sp. TaxID=1929291 RepID=UPI0037837F47